MAIVQSNKTAGSITVEATSPGLTAATATITSKSVKLRPQVPVWEREVPAGTGITGLWRPASWKCRSNRRCHGRSSDNVDSVYTFRQNGNILTGSVESSAQLGFGPGGGRAGGPIEDGKIDGSNISFRAGNTTYAGTINGEQIELRQTGGGGGRGGRGGPSHLARQHPFR